MAINDVVSDTQSIADTAYLTIQPGVGVEWSIHNIDFAGAVQISKYDGTDEVVFRIETAAGEYACVRHVTNGQYLRVKNVSGGTLVIGYDGVQTK